MLERRFVTVYSKIQIRILDGSLLRNVLLGLFRRFAGRAEMNFNAFGVVVVDDVRDGMELVIDGHDLSGPGNGLHQMGLRFPLLMGVVLVLIETKHDSVSGGFWGQRGFRRHGGQFIG